MDIIRHGRYRLSRVTEPANAAISEHDVEQNAIERAWEHAAEVGAGSYRIDPPWTEVNVPVTTIGVPSVRPGIPPSTVPTPPSPGSPLWIGRATQLIPRTGSAWNGSSNTSNPVTAMAPAFNYIKTEQLASGTGPGGASGYIYTVDPTTDIPWSSVNPTPDIDYVWAFEARPSMGISAGGYQTDFYVQRSATDPEQVMPLDHWAQQWLAIEKLQDLLPGVQPPRRWKWWYPCRDGHGSCHTSAILLDAVQQSGLCRGEAISNEDGYGLLNTYQSDPSATWNNENYLDLDGFTGFTGGSPQMGTLTSAGFLHWNEWVLVKWHFYPSGAAPGGGIYYNLEMWIRRYGTPTWTKIMDWRSGTQPCVGSVSNFDWRLIDRQVGHNNLRIPTTVGNAAFNPPDPNSDMMFYMGDICVALNEEDLPVYTDGT